MPSELPSLPSGANLIEVFHIPGESTVTLRLSLSIPGTESEKTPVAKTMSRQGNLEASKTLHRISMLLCPEAARAQSKQRTTPTSSSPPPPAVPLVSMVPLGPSTTAEAAVYNTAQCKDEDFWCQVTSLRINEVNVPVVYNRSIVERIGALPTPQVGVPLMCVDYTVLGPVDHLAYEWTCEDGGAVRVLSKDPVFTPTPDLEFLILTLRLSADPQRERWTECRTQRVKGPNCAMERWSYTPQYAEAPVFRIVTYNILYDGFCTNNFGKKHIYPFCTPSMLDEGERGIRLRRELLEYHPDLVCLQECGERIFKEFFLPSFRLLGFDGLHFCKRGSKEGCGYLYRVERFEMLAHTSLPLNFASLQQQFPDVAESVASFKELKDAMEHMIAIGTGVRFRDRATDREMVVGNTHFFYHADACHIRILQTALQMRHLQQLALRDGRQDPVIFCGDCNATATTGAYRLLTTGQVEEHHPSWKKGLKFWFGCNRKLGIEGTDMKVTNELQPPPPFGDTYFHHCLSAGYRMTDAYDACQIPLLWTNYTFSFKEVIDYIMFSEGSAEVVMAVPIPPERELNRNHALPNDTYASDHLALITDLRLV